MSRFENSDWQVGMPLPSRKETHARKKGKEKTQTSQAETAQLNESQAEREETAPLRRSRTTGDGSAQLRELLAAHEEVASATMVSGWTEVPESDPAWVEEETEPVIGKWTYRLLMVFVPILLVLVLAYGKLGYVHEVPDLVRENVSAYEQGEGFLVLKPWWFGPPVYTMDRYLGDAEGNFQQYQLNLHDFAAIVDEPIVLWRFQEDFLKK